MTEVLGFLIALNRMGLYYFYVAFRCIFCSTLCCNIWRQPLKYFYDSEFRFFLSVVLLIISISLIVHIISNSYADIFSAFGPTVFHVVSTVTTSGFTTENFSLWPGFLPYLLACWRLYGGMLSVCWRRH